MKSGRDERCRDVNFMRISVEIALFADLKLGNFSPWRWGWR
jgi:hypothetical protein